MKYNMTMHTITDELLIGNDLFFAEVERMLSQGQAVTLCGKGRSMLPFIVDGRDSVVLRQAGGDLAVGDIVLARVPGKGYVLHRIYEVHGEWLTLMGDGNLCVTEKCRREDVRGKAASIVRNGRTVDCASRAERFKAACWRRLLPVRRYLLYICRMYHRLRTSQKSSRQ